MEAMQFIKDLIKSGKKVGIFSCEDPYNTPFHRDLLQQTDYLHLVPQAAGRVVASSLDLGLQAKKINAWGIFGHYGVVNGHEVCAAIASLNNGHSQYGPHLSEYMQSLAREFSYDSRKSLQENIERWIKHEYDKLLSIVLKKQRTLKGTVQGDVDIFAGVVYNSQDGKSYKAEILFSNNGHRH